MKIYAPNIHLFTFQLYKISNLDLTKSQIDRHLIWTTGDEIVHRTLNKDLHLYQRLINVDTESNNPRLDLLKDPIQDNYAVTFDGQISLDHQNQDLLIKGFAYPLRLHDSYGLWLNLRRPEKENNIETDDLDIAVFSKLNPHNCLIVKENPLFLGQTLLITGWLTGAKDKKIVQQIAKECLKSIFHSYPLSSFNRQGELFGSPIFEYGLFSQIGNYQHVLIWLFADGEADTKFNQCYQELLDLWFFRTKSVKAFKDSREIYKALDLAYLEVETILEKFPKLEDKQFRNHLNLKDLKTQLKILPQLSLNYTRLLRNLEEYHNTIIINTNNYNERLQQIRDLTNSDLTFLETFSQKNSPYFQQQITADLGYFHHGSALLSQAIDSIRGIVEIEQAERDHSLGNLIQILGIGFGGGAIASGIITQHIDKISQPIPLVSLNNPSYPVYASCFWSAIATLCFTALGWLITKCK
ncbi:hypothetical protein ACX27_04880 [Nostoc piscinale CENA21]|uniref:Uncharacterized protein n=1 Tax=Nostoc piscinale CENA21 TaxID=224013 RepID=A0A0M4SV54_9NOSO|nr:hypothetical protein [Nostoc piscinale]ALF52334.1 hypothetical protein ACX27_04880 [Nostoc piscinale CENA21]